MKRAIKIISVFTLALLCLSGCKKKKEEVSNIDKFITIVEASEQSFTAYQEKDTMTDGTQTLYTKKIKFQVERNEDATKINTSYEKKETKLDLEPTTTSYKTVGNKKYVGSVASDYEIPNYWFNWNLKKEYLPEDYQLDIQDASQVLKCSMSADNAKNFFMDDSIHIDNLEVTIQVSNEQVTALNASYVSSHGYQVAMEITYSY